MIDDEIQGLTKRIEALEASELLKELQALLNRHSRENASNTPDYILANYMLACLVAFEEAVKAREVWYGRGPKDDAP